MNKVYHVLQNLQEPLIRRIFVSHLCQAFRYFTNYQSLPTQIKFFWKSPHPANTLKCHLSVTRKSILEVAPRTFHFTRTFSSRSGKIKLSKNNAFSKISSDKYQLFNSTSRKKMKQDMLLFNISKNKSGSSIDNSRADNHQQIMEMLRKNQNKIDLNKIKERGKSVYESIVDKLSPIVSTDKSPKKTSSIRGPLKKSKSKQDIMTVIANKRSISSQVLSNENEPTDKKNPVEIETYQRVNNPSPTSCTSALMVLDNETNPVSISNSKMHQIERDDRTQRKRQRERTNSFILSKENNNIKKKAKAKLFKKHQPQLDYHLKKLAEKYSKSSVAKTIKHLQNEYGNGAMKTPINENIHRVSEVKNKVLKHELKKKLKTGISKPVSRSTSNAYITTKPKVGLSNVFSSSPALLNSGPAHVKESAKPIYATLTIDLKRDLKSDKQLVINAGNKEIQPSKIIGNVPACDKQIIENTKNVSLVPIDLKHPIVNDNTRKGSNFDLKDSGYEVYRPTKSTKNVLTINIGGIIENNNGANFDENENDLGKSKFDFIVHKEKNNKTLKGSPSNQIIPFVKVKSVCPLKTNLSRDNCDKKVPLVPSSSSIVVRIDDEKENKEEAIEKCGINQGGSPKEEITAESPSTTFRNISDLNQTITKENSQLDQLKNKISFRTVSKNPKEMKTSNQMPCNKKECDCNELNIAESTILDLSSSIDTVKEKCELNTVTSNSHTQNDTEKMKTDSSPDDQCQSKSENKTEYLDLVEQLPMPHIYAEKQENYPQTRNIGELTSTIHKNKNCPSLHQKKPGNQGKESISVGNSINIENSIINDVSPAAKNVIVQNKKSLHLENNLKTKPCYKETRLGQKSDCSYKQQQQMIKTIKQVSLNLDVLHNYRKPSFTTNKDNQPVSPNKAGSKAQTYLKEDIKLPAAESRHKHNLLSKQTIDANKIKSVNKPVPKMNNKSRNIAGYSLPSSDHYIETEEYMIKAFVNLRCIKTLNIVKDLWNKSVDLPLCQRTFLLPKTNNLIMISSKNKINIDKKSISDCLNAMKSIQIQDLLYINPKLLIKNLPSELVGSSNPSNKNVTSEVFMLLVSQNVVNQAMFNKIIEFISNSTTNNNLVRTSMNNQSLPNTWLESKDLVTQGNIFLMHGPNKVSFHKVLSPSTIELKQQEIKLDNKEEMNKREIENTPNKEEPTRESKEGSIEIPSVPPAIPAVSADRLIRDCEKTKKKQNSTEPLLTEHDNTPSRVLSNNKIKEEKTPRTPDIIISKHMSSYTKCMDTSVQNANFEEFLKLIDSFEIEYNKDEFSTKERPYEKKNNAEKKKPISFSEFTNFVKSKRTNVYADREIKNKTSILPSVNTFLHTSNILSKNEFGQRDEQSNFISKNKSDKNRQIKENFGVGAIHQNTPIKSTIAIHQNTPIKSTITLLETKLAERRNVEDVVNKYVNKLKSVKEMTDQKSIDPHLITHKTEMGNYKRCCSPLRSSENDNLVVKESNPMQKSENWTPKSSGQLISHSKYSSEAAGLNNNSKQNNKDLLVDLLNNTSQKISASQANNSKSENSSIGNKSDDVKLNKDYLIGGSAHKLEINAGEGDGKFKLNIMYSTSPGNVLSDKQTSRPVKTIQQWSIVKLQPPTAKYSDLIKANNTQCFKSLIQIIREKEKLSTILELIKNNKSSSFKELIRSIENDSQKYALNPSVYSNIIQNEKKSLTINLNEKTRLALTHDLKHKMDTKSDQKLRVNYLNKPFNNVLNEKDYSKSELKESTHKYLSQPKGKKSSPISKELKLKKIKKLNEEHIPGKYLENSINSKDFFLYGGNDSYKTFNEILSNIKLNKLQNINDNTPKKTLDDKVISNHLSYKEENNAYRTFNEILTNTDILRENIKLKEEKMQNPQTQKQYNERITPKMNVSEFHYKNRLQSRNETGAKQSLQSNTPMSDTKPLSLPNLNKELNTIHTENIDKNINHSGNELRYSQIQKTIGDKQIIVSTEIQSKIQDLDSLPKNLTEKSAHHGISDDLYRYNSTKINLTEIDNDKNKRLNRNSDINIASNEKHLSNIVKEIHNKEMKKTALPIFSAQDKSSKELESKRLKQMDKLPIIDKVHIKLDIINETRNSISLSGNPEIKITGESLVEPGSLPSPSRFIKDQTDKLMKNKENELSTSNFINEAEDINVILPAECTNKLSIEHVTTRSPEYSSNNNTNIKSNNTGISRSNNSHVINENLIHKNITNSNKFFFNFKASTEAKRKPKINGHWRNKESKNHRIKCGSKMIHLITKQIKRESETRPRRNYPLNFQYGKQSKTINNQSKGLEKLGDSLNYNNMTQTNSKAANPTSKNTSVTNKSDNEGFISQSLRSESTIQPSSILFSGKVKKEQKEGTTHHNIKSRISKYRQNKKDEEHFQTRKPDGKKNMAINHISLTSPNLQTRNRVLTPSKNFIPSNEHSKTEKSTALANSLSNCRTRIVSYEPQKKKRLPVNHLACTTSSIAIHKTRSGLSRRKRKTYDECLKSIFEGCFSQNNKRQASKWVTSDNNIPPHTTSQARTSHLPLACTPIVFDKPVSIQSPTNEKDNSTILGWEQSKGKQIYPMPAIDSKIQVFQDNPNSYHIKECAHSDGETLNSKEGNLANFKKAICNDSEKTESLEQVNLSNPTQDSTGKEGELTSLVGSVVTNVKTKLQRIPSTMCKLMAQTQAQRISEIVKNKMLDDFTISNFQQKLKSMQKGVLQNKEESSDYVILKNTHQPSNNENQTNERLDIGNASKMDPSPAQSNFQQTPQDFEEKDSKTEDVCKQAHLQNKKCNLTKKKKQNNLEQINLNRSNINVNRKSSPFLAYSDLLNDLYSKYLNSQPKGIWMPESNSK